jgi:hypothetical protein
MGFLKTCLGILVIITMFVVLFVDRDEDDGSEDPEDDSYFRFKS